MIQEPISPIEPPAAEKNNVPWNVADVFKALGLLLLLNLALGFGLVLFMFVISKSRELTTNESIFTSLATVAITLSLVWYFTIRKHRANLRQLGIRKTNVLILLLIVPLTEIGVLAVENIYASLLYVLTKQTAPEQPIVKSFGHSAAGVILAFAVIVILAPGSEELFFRGFVYTALRKKIGVGWAMVLSALIFAVFHLSPLLMIPIFILAIALAWLYESRKSLLAPFMLHALNNLIALIYLYKK